MTKYYHRGGGECILINDRAALLTDGARGMNYIASQPIYAYCDPSWPVGWVGDVREQWQRAGMSGSVSTNPVFVNCAKEEYEYTKSYYKNHARIFLVPVEQPVPILTLETFEQEAERLYSLNPNGGFGVEYLNKVVRNTHIAARKMSLEELEAKDREIIKLQDKICDLQNQIFIYKIDNP